MSEAKTMIESESMSDTPLDLFCSCEHAPWPGTAPLDAPTRMVTHAGFWGTLWAKEAQHRATYAVHRVRLVTPAEDECSWYLDYRQGFTHVTTFCTWEPWAKIQDLLWAAAQANATDDAPAFRWTEAE